MTNQSNASFLGNQGRAARLEYKCAALSSDFGMKMLRLKFPHDADELLAQLGTYSSGPRKGQAKGYIHWVKVKEGGFDYGSGRVFYPGAMDWEVRASGAAGDDVLASASNPEKVTASATSENDAAGDVAKMTAQIIKLEHRLARAIEDKDFDDAGDIEQDIAALKRKIASL